LTIKVDFSIPFRFRHLSWLFLQHHLSHGTQTTPDTTILTHNHLAVRPFYWIYKHEVTSSNAHTICQLHQLEQATSPVTDNDFYLLLCLAS